MNTKFKKGIYIVGDLGYVMTDKQWKEVCDNTTDKEYKVGIGKVKTLADGTIYGIMGTHYGDGVYGSSFDKNFSVDSGTIGCMKVTDALIDEMILDANKDMHMVTKIKFRNDFFISKKKGGRLYFDNLVIYTNPVDLEWDNE